MHHIRQIRAIGFGPYLKETSWEIPKTGLVLITGDVGSGKSTIIEAVSECGWGETLRGKPLWNDQAADKQLVGLVLETFTAEGKREWQLIRDQKAKGSKLRWEGVHLPQGQGLTTTKTQELMEKFIGTHELWIKTSVFSSADADLFTKSGDADRKRLIERMCDLSKLDDASKACRKDLNKLEHDLELASTKVDSHQQVIGVLQNQVSDAHNDCYHHQQRTNVGALIPSKIEAEIAAVTEKKIQLRKDRERDIAIMKTLRKRISSREQTIRACDVQIENVKEDTCDTCLQQITGKHREETQERAQAARDLAASDLAKLEGEVASLEKVLTENELSQDECDEGVSKAKEQLTQARHELTAAKDLEEKLKKARTRLEDERDADDNLRAAHSAILAEVLLLKQVDKVLSLGGIRAHILQHALTAIEEISNVWLARLTEGTRIALRPYKEGGSGVRDAIQLEIIREGWGKDYKSCSGGQRRLLDIAIMLALAELAQASNNHRFGTMFFDEVFDALDTDCIDRVIDVLQELSKTKSIVVISHNDRIKEILEPLTDVTYNVGEP